MVSYIKSDLEFILEQIKISEAHASGQPLFGVGGLVPAYNLSLGLRTVDGTYNNLLPGQERWGAADIQFPEGLGTDFRPASGTPLDFDGPGGMPPIPTQSTYAPSNDPNSFVVDGSIRTISNLIVDQTLNNPAAIVTALERAGSADPFADLVIVQNAAELIITTTAAATAAQAAELAAEAAVAAATATQVAAQAAYDAALANNGAAVAALAATSDDAAAAADAATEAAAIALFVGGNISAADIAAVEAAVTAALAASNAAAAVVTGLSVGHAEFADAQAVQTNALTLHSQLVATRGALVEGQSAAPHFATIAAAATLADENVAPAESLTADLTALVDPDAVAEALAALTAANDALATAVANEATAEAASDAADAAAAAAIAGLATTLAEFGIEFDGENISLPNIAPDGGLSASFNSWFTLFGQFFDHGLDLVGKGGSGTVYIPLQPDDPLYVPGSHTNFMVLTRATVTPGADGIMGTADDVRPINTTTSFVDQNQTYTSHSSHQVFLRQYVLNADGEPVATGRLIEGANGGMATWGELKAQARDMLGIILTDSDVGNVPLLRTDQYGNFIPGANGTPQVIIGIGPDGIPNTADDVTISGTPDAPVGIAGAIRIGHAFLADIAHDAVPTGLADGDIEIGLGNPGNQPADPGAYDNELLDAHFIAGDGRVNENIGLTAVHHVFHAEHNRLVEHTKAVILATGDNAFIQEWLVPGAVIGDGVSDLEWNGERLFQAAKFGTEMQYQHLVFEEFARKVQPQINPFVVPDGYDVTINPSIVAEFAHVVYRFGHSMLTETIDRFDPSFNAGHIGLIEGFLNPFEFDEVGGTAHGVTDEVAAGAIIRGMTRQVGNEIDEFVTSALRNNLLGLPLDLATINLARGRDTGVPSLNAARREFYEVTNSAAELKPYESWVEFAANLKHEASIINFIAAYGNHALITGQTTIEGKRDAALTIITGQSVGGLLVPADAEDFLNGIGAYGVDNALGGLENVDLWIGGLAEKILPFGGMLGSTFNFVFEVSLEQLQNGDRFYYLQRLDGLHLFGEMEANSFAAMIMRNTDATHLPSDVFSVPGLILEIDRTKQYNPGLGETAGADGILADDPLTVGVDESADNLGNDPVGGGILTPLVIRNNPATPGADTNYLRYTGDQHVVLGGTAGNDILIASEGDDTLHGDAGNDFLEGGAGNDVHNGGDGDDIIKDLGGDDNIKGGAGNDVINSGPGLDLVLGGAGKDFVFLGNDAGGEVFGGEGDDFIYGNKNAERLLGNEGNDWIETGTFDGAPGDNFDELFARDGVVGHDVFLGDGGFDEFIAEGGDDVMVGSPGRGKLAGMSGWDWVTYKDNTFGVDADLTRGIVFDEFPNPPVNGTLDAYESVEGVSGSRFNDILTGADTLAADRLPSSLGGSEGYTGSTVTAESLALINGLDAVLGTGVTSYSAGDIILGGDGSDRITGRAGDDIIDGDKWLNVRISVRQNSDGTGPEVDSHSSMTTLAAAMFAGTYNPGQLVIVREILATGDAVVDTDTAVFSGAASEYIFAGNADGTIQVTHTVADGDGSDKLRGIERVEFAGGESFNIIMGTPGNDPALNGTNPGAPVGNDGNDLVVGLGGNDVLNGLGGNDILIGGDGTDTLNGGDGNDALDGGLGNDALNGGLGNDTYNVRLGDGNDTITELDNGGSADRLVIQTGSTEDLPVALTTLNAADNDTGTANGDLVVAVNGQTVTAINHFDGGNPQRGIESINFTGATYNGYLLGFEDYIVNRADPTGFSRTINLAASTANNFVAGENLTNDEIIGGSGNDLIFGGTGDNELQGGAGEDLLVGGSGAGDGDLLDGGLDADVMIGLNGNDTYVVDDIADVVVEALNQGTDTIETEMAVLSIEAVANVENLAYTGIDADPFVGTGNDLNNVITGGDLADTLSGLLGNDTLTGGLGADSLLGGDGNDTLNGGDDGDTLNGGIGTDTLNGGAGGDAMAGGADNDIYVVDDAGDVVNEIAAGSGGIDRVDSSISYTLGTNVENMNLVGGNTINGTGNALDNTIVGNNATNQLFGGGGLDVLTGNGGNDLLDGGTGNDTLSGGDNNDVIIGGEGNDLIDVGTGFNTIVYNASGFGNDTISSFDADGGTAATQDKIDLSGLGVTAANFATRVFESASGGNTVLTIREGGAASPIQGTITINGIGNASIDINDFTLATTPASTINGTAGNNVPLNGTVNADTINALAGNDSVNAGGGSDIVNGGTGNDTLNGDDGDDTFNWNANTATATSLTNSDGRDIVNGGAEGALGDTFVITGNAAVAETYRIYTRAAWDALPGNIGANLNGATEIVVTRGANTDFANSVIAELREIEEIRINNSEPVGSGSAGGDTIQVIGDFSGTSLRLNTITIDGEEGDDTIDISALTSAHRIVFKSNGGNDTIIGALQAEDVIELPEGADLTTYHLVENQNGTRTISNGTHSVTFTGVVPSQFRTDEPDEDEDENETPHDDGDDEETTATGVVRTGTAQTDTLVGTAADDNIVAFAGDDIAIGGAGADAIVAGEGADFVNAGSGRDVISAGAGDDHVLAGSDADIVYGDDGADRIFGEEGNDLINAGKGDDTVFGGAGNDLIVTEIGDGNDAYFGDEGTGGSGNDTLDMSAASVAVTVNLSSGPLMNGSASSSQTGNDTLWGIENVTTGSGNDVIVAGTGVNVMKGGLGDDTFRFNSVEAAKGDTIVDFEPGDRIDLSGIDANYAADGNQSFTLVSDAAFTAAGQLAVTFETRDGQEFTVVQGNVDGNAAADFKIEIAGHQNLGSNVTL
ncbi:peroxidase family protein [Bradyrhizobium sp. USDA 336]|uniref:peroxidase family protein n=1 Tax=Bradyrhizobium sp. USDA 336 TaxID=3156311 RepID=UPI003834AA05